MTNALFKFATGQGAVHILQGGALFITSPLDLNDPFEMRPAWTSAHQERHEKDQQRRSQMISGLPVMVAQAGGKLVPGGTMPYIPPEAQQDVELQRGIADMHNEAIFQRLHKEFRVLSLVKALFPLEAKGGESDEEATLMWAHYADQFQGVCLALDPSRFNNGIQAGGFEVDYAAERASLPPSYYDCWLELGATHPEAKGYAKDPGSELLLPQKELIEQERRRFINILTHKSPAWKYEGEVRMLYDIDRITKTADYRRPEFPCEECSHKGIKIEQCKYPWYRDAIQLPPKAVVAVIFGVDCMTDTVQQLFSIISRPEYRHVETYWSALQSSRYAVQYVKQEQNYIESIQDMRTRDIAQAKHHVWRQNGQAYIRPARKGTNYDTSKFQKPGGGAS